MWIEIKWIWKSTLLAGMSLSARRVWIEMEFDHQEIRY